MNNKPRTPNIEPRTPNQTNRTPQPTPVSGARPRVYDLEDRLLEFAVAVIDVSERLPSPRAGNHIAGQFLRAGTSPYGNHGEAESPESRDDFIHKLKICLKELRETRRWARLIDRKRWIEGNTQLIFVLQEVEELIRIFKASIQTAERNRGSATDSHRR